VIIFAEFLEIIISIINYYMRLIMQLISNKFSQIITEAKNNNIYILCNTIFIKVLLIVKLFGSGGEHYFS
jgi:hypothetical protein